MQWRGRRQSDNYEDGRSSGKGRNIMVGGGIGTILLLLLGLLFGQNPMDMINNMPTSQNAPVQNQAPEGPQPDDEELAFSRVVLAETEDVWTTLFQKEGYRYEPPTIHFYRDEVQSGCGYTGSQVGPFYCPADKKIYLDLSFFAEMQRRFGATGDFAAAYVIAHEVAHHIQNLVGISDKVQAMRGRLSEREYNKLSVKLELQADFLAGVWAHHTQKMKGILDPGDIEEALNAANAIGDDNIQAKTQGHVVPDAFTHGTSAQRVYWFKRGYETGDMNAGDTFSELQ